MDFIKNLNDKYNIKCTAYNVGAMMPYMNYTPQTLEEIIERSKCFENKQIEELEK